MTSDWSKHLAMLKDLTEHTWPVTYTFREINPVPSPWPVTYAFTEPGHAHTPLVYYFAYYLPAAALGKITSLSVAANALFVTTWLGLTLSLLWVHRLTAFYRVGACCIFLLSGGLDSLGTLFVEGQVIGADTYYEAWSRFEAAMWSYQSNATMIVWTPQHALAGWIATAFLLSLAQRRDSAALAWLPVICTLTLLWSPFVTLGLAPLALVFLRGNPWPRFLSSACLWLPLLVVGMLFLGASAGIHERALIPIWTYPTIVHFLTFIFFEFGALCLLLLLVRRAWPQHLTPFALVSSAFLVCLPVIKYGEYNDLSMRASIPSLFTLWVFALNAWGTRLKSRAMPFHKSFLLSAYLIFSAVGPISGYLRGRPHLFAVTLGSTPPQSVFQLPQDIARQYWGDPNALFFRSRFPNTHGGQHARWHFSEERAARSD
jgi:hypothetical protein